jgi:hypothetical protein
MTRNLIIVRTKVILGWFIYNWISDLGGILAQIYNGEHQGYSLFLLAARCGATCSVCGRLFHQCFHVKIKYSVKIGKTLGTFTHCLFSYDGRERLEQTNNYVKRSNMLIHAEMVYQNCSVQ